MTHSRWCETGGSAKFQQQGKHIDGVRDMILPVQTRSPAESGCSYRCTQPPQRAFISAKPRKTATLTWSILSLWENSINSAAAHSKGRDRIWVRSSPGLASARHQVSPTSWSTQIWSQNAAPSACLSPTGTIVTRTAHTPRKDGHFPPPNRMVFVSAPVHVSLVNSLCLQSLTAPLLSLYRKREPSCDV